MAPSQRWLVLVHQLSGGPAYHRVKAWRRLRDAGAIAIKRAVYVLPAGKDARVFFAEIARETEKAGGEAAVYEGELVAGMRDDQLRALFNSARDADYRVMTGELRQIAQKWSKAKKPKADPVPGLARISQGLAQLGKIDFFGAGGRGPAEALLAQLEHSAILRQPQIQKKSAIGPSDMTNKIWVTRRDIHIDRIASGWLIKRFIDPKGVLKFVPTRQYEPSPGEYRYDMQDGEFTHEGDHCSFETLLARSLIKDPALKLIAELVHDVDLKDGKFGHPETSGIAHVIAGICRSQGDDQTRLARGSELFDHIYEQFRRASRK